MQKRRTNQEWEELIGEQGGSGQTQAAWCAANGVNLHTFRERAKRARRIDEAPEAKRGAPSRVSTGWMEVKLAKQARDSADIRIQHGGFTVVVTAGFDAGLLMDVLRVVSRICC